MNRKHFASLLLTVSIVFVVGTVGMGQTQYGPYFIVDNTLAPGTTSLGTHIWSTLAGAVGAITTGGYPQEEMVGTTIILMPGTHVVGGPINLTVPGLRIVSQNGADKTRIVPNTTVPWPSGDMLTLGAAGTRIIDVTIDASAALTPADSVLQITARDCALKQVVVQGHGPGIGIDAVRGGDSLSLIDCKVLGNLVGLSAANVWDLHVVRGGFGTNNSGIQLTGCSSVLIEGADISGNGVNGVIFLPGGTRCSDIEIKDCSLNDNTFGIAGGSPAANIDRLDVIGCEVRGNVATGIAVAFLFQSSISGCTFTNNGVGAVAIIGPSEGVAVSNNTISSDAIGFPTNAILFTGPVAGSTIDGNSVSGYAVGIRFNLTGAGPSSNLVTNNRITAMSADGIIVNVSGGRNRFTQNSIKDCGGVGIRILSCTSDLYSNNEIASCTLDGVFVDDPAVISSLSLQQNVIKDCGENGISIDRVAPGTPPTALGYTNVIIADNTITGANQNGISAVITSALAGLRVEGNTIRQNQLAGAVFGGVGALAVSGNKIVDNLGVGLNVTDPTAINTQVLGNVIHSNDSGGMILNLAGIAGNALVEGNSFSDNGGFGLRVMASPPALTGILPYLHGYSLRENWWGHESGPAGLDSGKGNALLGVLNDAEAVAAPLLPAPVRAMLLSGSDILLNRQVSIIPSFAASRVKIDRTDTVGIQIVLSNVEPRANGWVATAAYDVEWLRNLELAPAGIEKGIAIMASGFKTGLAEVSIHGLSEGNKSIYICRGGRWDFIDGSNEWILSDCEWILLESCPGPQLSVLTTEIDVTDLLGDIKAIVVVGE